MAQNTLLSFVSSLTVHKGQLFISAVWVHGILVLFIKHLLFLFGYVLLVWLVLLRFHIKNPIGKLKA